MNARVVEVLLVALREEFSKELTGSLSSGRAPVKFQSVANLESFGPKPGADRTEAFGTILAVQVNSAQDVQKLNTLMSSAWSEQILRCVAVIPDALWSQIPAAYFRFEHIDFVTSQVPALCRSLRESIIACTRVQDELWEQQSKRVLRQALRHLGTGRTDGRSIQWFLGRLASLLQCQRSYVCEFTQSGNAMSVAHEWCAPGVSSQRHRLQGAPSSRFTWFAEEICSGRAVVLHSLDDLPRFALTERVELEHEGVRSCLCAPIVRGRRSIGFVGVSTVFQQRTWQQFEIDYVKTVAAVIAANTSTQARLREVHGREAMLRAVLNTAPDGFVLFDEEDEPVLINDAAREQLPLLADYVPSKDAQRSHFMRHCATRLLNESLAQNASVGDCTLPTREGQSLKVVRAALTHGDLPDSFGADQIQDQTLLLLRNVTKETELETQLRQAQKLEAVGRMAGGVSHDFNNLLTAILGYVGLLLQEAPEGSKLHDCLMQVRASGLQASELIKQLLLFSGKRPDTAVCVPDEVLTQVSQSFFRVLGEQYAIHLSLQAPSACLALGSVQFQQIVLNLILNARDAMPDGGEIFLNSGFEHDEQGEGPGFYVLRIRDTGSGMSEEVLAKLFEPFFTTKEEGKGTGLGLATVFEIIQSAQGDVEVMSTPAQGTEFLIRLPNAQQDAAPDEALKVETIRIPNGTETILLVEDEESVRLLIQEVLELAGYSVLAARHGREALRIAETYKGRIDAVVADMVMPYLGGLELTQRLRRIRPKLRIVLVSGYHGSAYGDLSDICDESCIFISKPFQPVEFATRLRQLLDVEDPFRTKTDARAGFGSRPLS